MGLFSKKSQYKIGSLTETAVKLLDKWEQSHFPKAGSKHRYDHYLRETGEKISLVQIALPTFGQQTGEDFFSQLKRMVAPEYGQPPVAEIFSTIKKMVTPTPRKTLPALIDYYMAGIRQEIQRFRENIVKLGQLDETVRSDSFFPEADRLFGEKIKQMHHELWFWQPEEMGNAQYYVQFTNKLNQIVWEMAALNRSIAEYMYALASTGQEDTRQALENIRIRVDAMSSAAKTIQ